MSNSNGTQTLPTTSAPRFRVSQSASGNGDSTHLPEPAPILVRLQRIGCAMRMTIRVLAIGIGTTGAACVDLWVKRILLERAGRGLPMAFDYLLMDAANPQPGLDIAHFYQLLGGHGGSGSVAHEGHKLFFTPDNYRRLRHTLNTKTLGIMDGESEFVTKSAHEATAFVIVAGPGGTGGGTLHPLIGLVHDMAQDRHIREPLVHVVQIGAEMPLRDKNRHVTLEQQRNVRSNAANNLQKILRDMTTDGYVQEPRPDGTSFQVNAGRRVWSITTADQSNGFSEFATIDELLAMVSDHLFFRFFTQAGAYIDERFCDLNRTGVTGRGQV